MNWSEEERQRIASYERVHLKKDQLDLPPDKKMQAVQQREKRLWLMLGFNLLAVFFFGYSYFYNITRLSDTILIILALVFLVNIGMVFYQKKQVDHIKTYLNSLIENN